jgi:hypothetical protein
MDCRSKPGNDASTPYCKIAHRITIMQPIATPETDEKPVSAMSPIRARNALIDRPRNASVPIPKFASLCSTLSCELRNQRDTSKVYVSSAPFEPEVRQTDSRLGCGELRDRSTIPPSTYHRGRVAAMLHGQHPRANHKVQARSKRPRRDHRFAQTATIPTASEPQVARQGAEFENVVAVAGDPRHSIEASTSSSLQVTLQAVGPVQLS